MNDNTKKYKEQECMNDCIVCSNDNPASLHARFFSIEPGVVEARFTGRELHASYKGRMHGGVIAAVLDETMGRTLWTDRPEKLAVTAKMEVSYIRPVPLGVELKCIGRITSEDERTFKAQAEITLPDGTVAPSSKGLYVFQSKEQIAEVSGKQTKNREKIVEACVYTCV